MRKRHSSITMFDIIIHTIKCVIFNQRPGCQNYLLSQQEQHRIRHMQTFQNIPYPLLSPSTTYLTADNFANYFTRKTTSNSTQFSAPLTHELTANTHPADHLLSSFFPLTEGEVSNLFLSSHPTISPHISCKLFPLHFCLRSHTSSTHTSLLTGISHHIQAGSGNPTA